MRTIQVISYGGKTIPRWRTAAILKIDISPYLSEKSPDFHEILYTAADFELDERHVIKYEKSCIGQTPSSTERISCFRHKARYWSKISIFSYPLHSTLALGVPRRNIAIPFGVQKLEWCGYPTVTKYRRVTDRWTDVTYGRTGNAAATMGVTKVSSA